MDTNFTIAETEVRQKYRTISEGVLFKQITPEDGAKQIINDINAILTK
jgi:hypothetical protein